MSRPCTDAPPSAAPASRRPSQCRRLPIVLTSSRTGPVLLPTSTSTSPSLSRSPNAAPRLTSDSSNTAPARSVTSSKRRSPRLRNSVLRCPYGNGSSSRPSTATTVPLTAMTSSRAVVVEVEPRRAPAGVGQAARSQPGRRALVPEHPGAVVDVEVVALGRQVRHEQVFISVVVEVAGIHAHAGLRGAEAAQRRAGEQGGVHQRAVPLVDPQEVLGAVVGDVDVQPAVAVVVGGGDAQRGSESPQRRARDPAGIDVAERARADVLERAVAAVAIEAVGQPPVGFRRAVVARPRRVGADGAIVEVVVDVVADVQIQPTVPVVVDERRGDAERVSRTSMPARVRHVGERPVAVVPKEPFRFEARHEQIDPAVVVEVSRRHPEAVSVGLQAALFGHVDEAPRSVPVRRRSRGRCGRGGP